MIAAHQPTIFGKALVTGLSSVDDGHMKLADDHDEETKRNITNFIRSRGTGPDTLQYMRVTYDGDNFCRYATVGRPTRPFPRIVADGLATNEPGVALFLPLADCTGAILYDPVTRALMLAHLGRHSTEQSGARHNVKYMQRQFRSDPRNILAWLSPSPGSDAYPLFARGNTSLHEANRADLLDAGVTFDHIEVSPVDTAIDVHYYSHSEFLKGNRPVDGRFAIVAMLP